MTSTLSTLLTAPLTSNSEAETEALAAQLAGELVPGMFVLLDGDLGAGKTAFVRGLATGLGIAPDVVSSPTFTLVQRYAGGRFPLWHVDLYRIDQPADVQELALDDLAAAGGVVVVEWAERFGPTLPPGLRISLADLGDDRRQITGRLIDYSTR